MKKTSILKLLSLLIIFFVFISGCTQNDQTANPEDKETQEENNEETVTNDSDYTSTFNSHFGFMHPEHKQEMHDLPVYWQRPHTGPFVWHIIEEESGVYTWEKADEEVKESQEYDLNIIATIWPFADWDQKNCNSMLSKDQTNIFSELGEYRGKPCDMDSYKEFVKKLVERYDGDGVDDMKDLSVPIKYWEVSNEPSMQEDLVFFTGTSEDYYDILKATYEAVKEADSEATVLMGGMAGVSEEMDDFWQGVFDLGGASYFDIANVHSIGSNSEDLFAGDFKDFLTENNIDKPFWITEAQLSSSNEKEKKSSSSEEDWESTIVKTFVRAFASGAKNIFYVGLEEAPGDSGSWLIKNDAKQDTYYAFQTMVENIDYFTYVKAIAEDQYNFTVNNTYVYVLWGNMALPEELTGNLTVIDIKENSEVKEASEVILTDSPLFITKETL